MQGAVLQMAVKKKFLEKHRDNKGEEIIHRNGMKLRRLTPKLQEILNTAKLLSKLP